MSLDALDPTNPKGLAFDVPGTVLQLGIAGAIVGLGAWLNIPPFPWLLNSGWFAGGFIGSSELKWSARVGTGPIGVGGGRAVDISAQIPALGLSGGLLTAAWYVLFFPTPTASSAEPTSAENAAAARRRALADRARVFGPNYAVMLSSHGRIAVVMPEVWSLDPL